MKHLILKNDIINTWKNKECIIEIIRDNKKKVINMKERVDDIYIEEKQERLWSLNFLLKSDENGAIVSPFLFLKTFLELKNNEELNIRIKKKCFMFKGGVYGREFKKNNS